MTPIRRLTITRTASGMPGSKSTARLMAGPLVIPCRIGRSGIVHDKREGDGATPAGTWRMGGGFFRADRVNRPNVAMGIRPLRRDDGWCDDASNFQYNRWVRLPFTGSHETMWMHEPSYDIVLVLDHNQSPRVRGRGSAIFFHLTRTSEAGSSAGTAGCIAISAADMRRLLPRLAHDCRMVIR
jgi:L,D-peptidoglycan transpeptidase YkuD (ErfK/YbiS/YcfS/YnhG family)